MKSKDVNGETGSRNEGMVSSKSIGSLVKEEMEGLISTYPDRMVIHRKAICVGDSGVGKTSFILRSVKNKFVPNSCCTIGYDQLFLEFKMTKDYAFSFCFIDTAGQERFTRSLPPRFFRSSAIVFFVYDITQRSSFEGLQRWKQVCIRKGVDLEKVTAVLVGNKFDECEDFSDVGVSTTKKRNPKFVSREEGYVFSLELGDDSHFFEVSSKSGCNVEKCLKVVLRKEFEKMREEMMEERNILHSSYSGTYSETSFDTIRLEDAYLDNTDANLIEKKKPVETGKCKC